MTRDEAVARVQEILGFRTDLEDNIVRRMQMVQDLLEQGKTLPWFLVVENHPLTVTAGSDPVIPADFIREVEWEHAIHWRESATTRPVWLRKMGYDEALYKYAETDDGDAPVAYAIRTSTFRIFPRTSVNTTLYFDYYAHDDPISDLAGTAENDWLDKAPHVIVGNAGASIASTVRNPSAKEEFVEMARLAWDAVAKENILRQASNRQYVLGRNS